MTIVSLEYFDVILKPRSSLLFASKEPMIAWTLLQPSSICKISTDRTNVKGSKEGFIDKTNVARIFNQDFLSYPNCNVSQWVPSIKYVNIFVFVTFIFITTLSSAD